MDKVIAMVSVWQITGTNQHGQPIAYRAAYSDQLTKQQIQTLIKQTHGATNIHLQKVA